MKHGQCRPERRVLYNSPLGQGFSIMKVKNLLEKLQKCNPELEVVIQLDENGWHATDGVAEVESVEEEKFVNIYWED